MKRIAIAAALLLGTGIAQATPILQAHLQGATAGDQPTDEDTWFLDANAGDTVTLDTMGIYNTNQIQGMNNVALVLTTPEGQTPNLSMALPSSPGSFVTAPLGGPFDDENAFEAFLGRDFPSHAPYGLAADQVDLYLLAIDTVFPGMGYFDPLAPVPNCDASVAGTTTCGPANPYKYGETVSYLLQVTGVDWIHFDLIAEVTRQVGHHTVTDWEINPFSHDSTLRLTGGGGTGTTPVPLPGTLPLLALPLVWLGLRRR